MGATELEIIPVLPTFQGISHGKNYKQGKVGRRNDHQATATPTI